MPTDQQLTVPLLVLVGREAAAEEHAPVGELGQPATDPATQAHGGRPYLAAECGDGSLRGAGPTADHPNAGSGALERMPSDFINQLSVCLIFWAEFPDTGSISGSNLLIAERPLLF